MSKIAVITDLHLGARNDNKTVQEHQNKFFQEIFFPTLIKNNVGTVLHGGDLFENRNRMAFSTLENSRKILFEPLRELGVGFHSIIGNHDIAYKNTINSDSKSLLLQEYKNIHIIKTPTIFSKENFEIGLVPWIADDNRDEVMDFLKTTSTTRILGHFDIVGFTMQKGIKSEHGLDRSVFNNFHTVWSGHYHAKSKQGNIEYLGSPYAMSWGEHGFDHGMYIVDTETQDTQFIKNPYHLFHMIEYNDMEKDTLEDYEFENIENCFVKVDVIHKSNPVFFDQLISEIEEKNPFKLDIRDIRDYKVSLPENSDDEPKEQVKDTLTFIKDYVNKIDTKGLDKKRIMAKMTDLYIEAQKKKI